MAAAAQPVSANRLRVLMAGGDKVNLAHVSGLLAKSGYEMTVVENGIAALQALESEGPPPLAVLDWTMPELNGIDVCRKMRNANRRRSTYIILLTPWNQRDDRVVGLEAGADDCVYKPVDVRELRVRLQIGAQIILERALRESEERFRSAFEYAGIGIAVVRVSGEFLQVNPALCNFLGYSADDLLQMSLHSICHPEDVPSSEVLLRQFLKGEYRSGEFERRFVGKNGCSSWAAFTVSVVLDADDHASCFVVQIQDISERKRAEQALKESLSASKQALKELADQQYAMDQHSIVGITDTEGRITYANDKFCAISKYSREELLGQNYRVVNSGYHGEEFFRTMYEAIGRGVVWTGEFRNRAKGGDFFWVDTTIVPFLGSDGKPRQYVSIQNDITDHKTTEEALRRSEALFHAISHNVEDLMQVCDMNLNWLHLSESFRTKLGYAPEELLGTSSRRIIHADDLPNVERAAQEIISSGQPRTVVIRYQHRNGDWIHVEATGTLLRNSAGNPDGFVVVSRLIEERLQAEKKVREAHAETELFLRSIPSILIGLDAEGRITRWNLTAAKTLDLKDDRALGRPIYDCGVHWLHPDIQGEVARWLATESSLKCDDLGCERNGQSRFLSLLVHRIPAHDNEPSGFILTGDDVTRRKYLEDQLRQAQKLEAIGQLAAGIAHEINTPTQYVGNNTRFVKESWDSIAGFLEFCGTVRLQALTGALAPDTLSHFEELYAQCDFDYLVKEIPHALEQSMEGLQRVSHIVRGMKEFSHPGTEEKRAVNLNRAIETTITVSRHEWKYCAEVVPQFDETLPLVPCLVGEFNQVILNLIINAAHAIATALGANTLDKGTIRISTSRDGTWARIAITDTGTGIPPEIRSRVFEPFFTTKDVGKGTGQGLALAHSAIVNRHQGEIWFDSEVGRGTTFFIRLPLDVGFAVT